jgi:hypothetical protein
MFGEEELPKVRLEWTGPEGKCLKRRKNEFSGECEGGGEGRW